MVPDPSLTFRRATLQDRPAVEALCAKIWEGDDYLPRCFEAWVSDQEGELTLCYAGDRLAGDRLAGIAKLTWLAPGEAWLEGLRKDPDVPVKGIGSTLCRRYLGRLAQHPGLRSIRFSTYVANHASIHLNEALGFRRIACASVKGLTPKARPEAQDPRIGTVRNAEQALAMVRASGWFGAFIHQSWRSYPWSEDLFLSRWLEPGHCLGLFEAGRLRAMAACLIDPVKGDGAVPFFHAEDEASAAPLLGYIEDWFAREGAHHTSAIVPPGGQAALRMLDNLGWKSWEQEEDYLVYEFPLENLQAFRP